MRSTIGIVLLFVLTAAPAAAQACLGFPTMPRQLALDVRYDSGENDTGYGARAVAFLPASIAAGVSYRLDDYDVIDTFGHTFGGVVAAELPIPGNSFCLLVEPSYSIIDWPAGFGIEASRFTTLRLPALAGVGTRLDLESFFVVPSARGGVVHLRRTAEPVAGGAPLESSMTEVMIDAGVTAGAGSAFATIGLQVISGQNTRPRYRFGIGYMLP